MDLRRLTLLSNVLFADGTLEHDVALQQIAVKDVDSHSWFIACDRLLHKYNLPIHNRGTPLLGNGLYSGDESASGQFCVQYLVYRGSGKVNAKILECECMQGW